MCKSHSRKVQESQSKGVADETRLDNQWSVNRCAAVENDSWAFAQAPAEKGIWSNRYGETNKKDVVHEIENRPATKKKEASRKEGDVATDRSSEKSETEGRLR